MPLQVTQMMLYRAAQVAAVLAVVGCADQVGVPIQRGPPPAVFQPGPVAPGPVLEPADGTRDDDEEPTIADSGSAPAPKLDAASEPDAPPPSVLPQGELCAACNDASECGTEADLCILNTGSGESFCGSACESDLDCPSDYLCVDISGATEFKLQCVPRTTSCLEEDSGVPEVVPTLAETHLDHINTRRAELGKQPVELSNCLVRLADESQNEFLSVGRPHTKFDRECRQLPTECECRWDGEFQLEIDRDGRTLRDVLEALYSPDIHNGWVGESKHRRVGFVIAYNDARVWITNAYGL